MCEKKAKLLCVFGGQGYTKVSIVIVKQYVRQIGATEKLSVVLMRCSKCHFRFQLIFRDFYQVSLYNRYSLDQSSSRFCCVNSQNR